MPSHYSYIVRLLQLIIPNKNQTVHKILQYNNQRNAPVKRFFEVINISVSGLKSDRIIWLLGLSNFAKVFLVELDVFFDGFGDSLHMTRTCDDPRDKRAVGWKNIEKIKYEFLGSMLNYEIIRIASTNRLIVCFNINLLFVHIFLLIKKCCGKSHIKISLAQ